MEKLIKAIEQEIETRRVQIRRLEAALRHLEAARDGKEIPVEEDEGSVYDDLVIQTHSIQSEKRPWNPPYTVVELNQASPFIALEYACSCYDFRYRRIHRFEVCKHIQLVRARSRNAGRF